MRAFLWCNGDIPSLETRNILTLDQNSSLFGVDGGTTKAISCGFFVEETFGDLDSIKQNEINGEVTRLPDDSFSDLTKTILELSQRGYSEFDILGIDGGSPGHILGIWGSLVESSPQLKIRLHHHNAISHRITPENGKFQIHLEKEQLFSVFALSKCKKIVIKGAKWEIASESLELSTKGLHNRGTGELLTIKGDGVIALIIEN